MSTIEKDVLTKAELDAASPDNPDPYRRFNVAITGADARGPQLPAKVGGADLVDGDSSVGALLDALQGAPELGMVGPAIPLRIVRGLARTLSGPFGRGGMRGSQRQPGERQGRGGADGQACSET